MVPHWSRKGVIEGVKADVVICGAGIAGISAAYYLTVHHGIRDVLLVDERAPLTLTSDKSTEAYRNWWPGPGSDMVQVMDHSIDLLEDLVQESGNRFHMNHRGYVYLSADPTQVQKMVKQAKEISILGAGALRINQPYEQQAQAGRREHLRGAELILDRDVISKNYPFLNPGTLAMLHTRRCGWLSAQQLGMLLLEKARENGTRLLEGRVTAVEQHKNAVRSVTVRTQSVEVQIQLPQFVNAAGPYLKQVGRMLGVDLPVYNERHGKIAFEDPLGIIPRDCPMMIWNDPIMLPWSKEEREDLGAFEDTAWLLEEFSPGLHFRPEGGPGSQTILALWPYHIQTCEQPAWPITFDPEFVEAVMRGMMVMVPGLSVYQDKMSRPTIDGGYYTKTRENRFLSCPLPVDGAYVYGALSGYGIMAALAGAELLTGYMTGAALPQYAPAFHLDRYEDPDYQLLLKSWDSTAGQL